MRDFLDILAGLGIDNRLMTVIAPISMTGRHNNEEEFYTILSNELRNFIYKHHYNSSIVLQLADDVPIEEKKSRLEQTVLPYLQTNNILALG